MPHWLTVAAPSLVAFPLSSFTLKKPTIPLDDRWRFLTGRCGSEQSNGLLFSFLWCLFYSRQCIGGVVTRRCTLIHAHPYIWSYIGHGTDPITLLHSMNFLSTGSKTTKGATCRRDMKRSRNGRRSSRGNWPRLRHILHNWPFERE